MAALPRSAALHMRPASLPSPHQPSPACLPLLDPSPQPARGADVGIKNAEGKTAAEVAEMNEQAAVVELLKSKA